MWELVDKLSDEQVGAKVVHYRADLETNPDLDAVTAGVVAELERARDGRSRSAKPRPLPEMIRASHERVLFALLRGILRSGARSLLVPRRVKRLDRRVARLYFETELEERARDGEVKLVRDGEQAIAYLLARHRESFGRELGTFAFESADVRRDAEHALARLVKTAQESFLAKRAQQLARIVRILNAVLGDFLGKHLPAHLQGFVAEVVAQSGCYEGRARKNRIFADGFARFRAAFDRRFAVHLMGFVDDAAAALLDAEAVADREPILQFLADPRLFTLVAGELTEGIYEFLHQEGFLDLPDDFRGARGSRRPPP